MERDTPILIVDDYRTMLRIIRNLLKEVGFIEVEEAADGASALARLKARRFGLVICDWAMEPVSGLDLLRQVRAEPALHELPFILITTARRSGSVQAAEAAGANGTIVKPFNAQTLATTIEEALARA